MFCFSTKCTRSRFSESNCSLTYISTWFNGPDFPVIISKKRQPVKCIEILRYNKFDRSKTRSSCSYIFRQSDKSSWSKQRHRGLTSEIFRFKINWHFNPSYLVVVGNALLNVLKIETHTVFAENKKI